MHRIFSHQNIGIVHSLKNVLENHGIETEVKGEHLIDATGGIAPTDAWVELWLIDEGQSRKAQQIVDDLLKDAEAKPESQAWICPNCGEEIDGTFALCWNCETERP